jgi:hypothetical protein
VVGVQEEHIYGVAHEEHVHLASSLEKQAAPFGQVSRQQEAHESGQAAGSAGTACESSFFACVFNNN